MTCRGLHYDSSNIKMRQIIKNLTHAYTHELREPIRSVSNITQLLSCHASKQLDNKDLHYLTLIQKSVKRMDTLTKDISYYLSIIEQKKYITTNINTNNILHYIKEKFQKKVHDRSIIFTIGSLPTVVGVQSHIYRLFFNLIDNALKFKSENPLNIHIFACEQKENWEFHICDNGIGIEKQYHTVIFNMFYRLHAHNHYTGSGIGLALCKEIVDQHKGTIFVQSKPGAGSTFIFTLPKNKPSCAVHIALTNKK